MILQIFLHWRGKAGTHGSFVQQSRDTEDVVVTDVGHGTFDDTLAALQTAVTLERIPRSLTINPMEHVQLSDPGYHHQLHREEEGGGGMEQGSRVGKLFHMSGFPNLKLIWFTEPDMEQADVAALQSTSHNKNVTQMHGRQNVQSRLACMGSGCRWVMSRAAEWVESCNSVLSRSTPASPAARVWGAQQSVRACWWTDSQWDELRFHLDPGGREMDCWSPLWMELLQWPEEVGGLKTGRSTRTFTCSHWSGSWQHIQVYVCHLF